MKKLLYYIVPLLAMLACTEQVEWDGAAEGKLGTTISVVLPHIPNAHPQTRAMAKNPQMENLYLAVFDDNGYLMEYVKAGNASVMASENTTEYKYEVTLKPTDVATTIHFIGNSPTASLNFGSEEELLASLYTENGNEAYWQRVVLSNGIKNDESTKTLLTGVKLIRNFAWINVISTAENFTVDAYCVVNTRTKGSVAPYNTNADQFVSFNVGHDYVEIVGTGSGGQGYNGFVPSGAEINSNIPTENGGWFVVPSNEGYNHDNNAFFIYEREKALSNPSYILVRGTYKYVDNDGEEITMSNRYYKVDLRDSDGNYFPIIRNFRYRIKLTSIGHSGYDSAEDAANGAGSGDVSSAIETQTYNNISNGDARLFVSYTDTTIVDYKPEEGYKLRYKYVIFNTDGTERIENDSVTISCTGNALDGEYTCTTSDISQGTWKGWREITYRTTELPVYPQTKNQQFVFTGTDTNGNTLQRKVNILLRQKYDLQLECDPTEIPNELGKPFDLIIKVPGGLGKSMFPLDIQLEAVAQSMTPNLGDNLPTVTGPSIVPGKGKTTIGFIKQLSRAEYEYFFEVLHKDENLPYMPVPCHFKSNKAESATMIYASNKYFNQANTSLGNFDAAYFSDLKFSTTNENLPTTVNQPINFTFKMSKLPSAVTGSDGKVTVALCNLMPADDDKNNLSQINVDTKKGIAYYTFTPTSTSVTLKLVNTDVNVEAKVMLSSYHFEDAERAMIYTKATFKNLNLAATNKYLTKDSEVTFKFRLSRQVKQGRYITVTLGNLVPADTRLTVIDEKAGTYSFDPTGIAADTDITLNLKVKNSYQTISAKLSADYFEDNSASKDPSKGTFSGLNLTSTNPMLTAGSDVTFSFTVPELPNDFVTITLENLEPETGVVTRSTSFNYTPQQAVGSTESLTFKVIESYKTVKVTISSDCFDDASESLEPKFIIPKGNIMGLTENTTYTLYYSDPGKVNNPSSKIVDFNRSYDSTNKIYSNSSEIILDAEDYQAVVNNGGNVYVRYTTGTNNNRKYYIATVKLSNLMDEDGATLNFERRN